MDRHNTSKVISNVQLFINEMTALSHGERVARDGVFISRRGPGEGSLPVTGDEQCPKYS
jgi:hypothetical protein